MAPAGDRMLASLGTGGVVLARLTWNHDHSRRQACTVKDDADRIRYPLGQVHPVPGKKQRITPRLRTQLFGAGRRRSEPVILPLTVLDAPRCGLTGP
jgi:hypothetical protein